MLIHSDPDPETVLNTQIAPVGKCKNASSTNQLSLLKCDTDKARLPTILLNGTGPSCVLKKIWYLNL
jgi:hypothetical protein